MADTQAQTQDNVVQQLIESVGKELDAYGRDSAERTVELNQHVAEAVNCIVEESSIDVVLSQLKAEYEGGEPTTYDDAIGYIVYRGIAEIKRQRDAAAATKAKSKLAETQKLYKAMLAVNPSLITDAKFVEKMVAALGM
jgi:hypothetical protein